MTPAERQRYAFILTKCAPGVRQGDQAEFQARTESDAIAKANDALAGAEPGFYLLSKQVTTLVVPDQRKVRQS